MYLCTKFGKRDEDAAFGEFGDAVGGDGCVSLEFALVSIVGVIVEIAGEEREEGRLTRRGKGCAMLDFDRTVERSGVRKVGSNAVWSLIVCGQLVPDVWAARLDWGGPLKT